MKVHLDARPEGQVVAAARGQAKARAANSPQGRSEVGRGPFLFGVGPEGAGGLCPGERAVVQGEQREEALRAER